MLLQAVVDHNCLFKDLCIGWPGSVHDARVLANSVGSVRETSRSINNGSVMVMLQVLLRNCDYFIQTYINGNLNMTYSMGETNVTFPILQNGQCEVRLVSQHLGTLDMEDIMCTNDISKCFE